MNKLTSITIKGYKSIKEQTLAISGLNVLIGQNGAGKSNFISLFEFLKDVIEGKLQPLVQKAGGADELLYYGSRTTKSIEIELDFKPNLYHLSLKPTSKDSLFIDSESCGYWRDIGVHAGTPYWDVVTRSKEESLLGTRKRTHVQDYVYDTLKEWRVYHFQDTSDTAGMKKYSSIADSEFLFDDASNLAAYLYFLRQSETGYYQRIVKTVQLVIPFFKDFVLRPNPLNPEIIRLEWQDRYSDKIFSASSLSDGSLRFICMSTLLLQKNLPSLIILDEPELGLHPSAIAVLGGLLKKASVRTQVIISTQSVGLINEFDANNVVVVDREGAASVFRRLDNKELGDWLDRYSLGDIWEKNIIGGTP